VVTVFLFQLTAIWNNFFLPMVMLSDQKLYRSAWVCSLEQFGERLARVLVR